MAATVTFDGWSLGSVGTVGGLTTRGNEGGSPEKSADAHASVLQETTGGGVIHDLTVSITGTSEADLAERLQTLLRNTAGMDERISKGMLSLNSGYHYWSQRTDWSTERTGGEFNRRVSLSFFSESSFLRADTLIQVSKSGSFTITNGSGQDFLGDAPRIPIRINAGGGWLAGEKFILENTTTGEVFVKEVTQSLGSGEDLVINGDSGVVMEGARRSNAKVSGAFPWISGNQTNSLDSTNSDRSNTWQISFRDLFYPWS